jgi:TRAP-type mannitol/chloroaromatic compound transport system permease small subunit
MLKMLLLKSKHLKKKIILSKIKEKEKKNINLILATIFLKINKFKIKY